MIDAIISVLACKKQSNYDILFFNSQSEVILDKPLNNVITVFHLDEFTKYDT